MSNSTKAGDIKNSQGVAMGEGARAEVTIHNYPVPVEKPAFPIHHIAHPQNPNFTGREKILKKLTATLNAEETAVVIQTIAGLGGVGKTQLALAYSYDHLEDYDLIYWLNADSKTTLNKELFALANCLKIAAPNSANQQTIIQELLHWLGQTDQRWLLVYDNADQIEPQQLAAYLPRTGTGHVLITSRNPNLRGLSNVLELDVLTHDDAFKFLYQRSGLKVKENTTQWQEASALVETLGRFPLALEHAAAYVEAKSSDFGTYNRLFTNYQAELWNRANQPEHYRGTIVTTWALAFEEVKKTPGAIELLLLCSFLAPREIQISIIKQLASIEQNQKTTFLEAIANDLEFHEALGTLRRYSFIQRNHDVLVIHQLVQLAVRQNLPPEQKEYYANLLFELFVTLFKSGTRESSIQLIVHFKTLVENNEELIERFSSRVKEDAELYQLFLNSIAFWVPKLENIDILLKTSSEQLARIDLETLFAKITIKDVDSLRNIYTTYQEVRNELQKILDEIKESEFIDIADFPFGRKIEKETEKQIELVNQFISLLKAKIILLESPKN